MKLEEFKTYNLAMELGEKVWDLVYRWNWFEKDTVGKQLVKAADSIAANLSEGYGRYHFNEARHFCYYSRGSLYETKTWLIKARQRDLITEEELDILLVDLENIAKKLNAYINSIGKGTHQP